jgi:hypothetical protein
MSHSIEILKHGDLSSYQWFALRVQLRGEKAAAPIQEFAIQEPEMAAIRDAEQAGLFAKVQGRR